MVREVKDEEKRLEYAARAKAIRKDSQNFLYTDKMVFTSQKEKNPDKIKIPNKKIRARDGTRTRDPDLGKVVLHQLSHSRIK